MRKYSESSAYPETFEKWDATHWKVNYNVVEDEREEPSVESTKSKSTKSTKVKFYKFEYILIETVDKGSIVSELVRNDYSVDDELAILRQKDTKVEEFNTYNTYVESCKTLADSLINTFNSQN